LGLNVDEVSVVDSPANEVEFLVTKNLEDSEMAGKASDEAERVAVEQPASDEAVSKALEHVDNIVENIAKAFGLPSVAAGAVAAATPAVAPAPVAAETVVTEESTEKAMTMKDLMKAMGAKDDEETMKKLKAAGFDPEQKFPTAKKPADSTKTTKAASEDAPFTMDGFAELITKAKKFTPGRVASLKSALETLKALMDDIEEIPQGTMPGVSPGGSTQFGASGVKGLTAGVAKAADVQILEALTNLATVVKSLKEDNKALEGKIEEVSKARPASESLEAAGGTETKVTKSALWSGVL
jgi:hypothetical protein